MKDKELPAGWRSLTLGEILPEEAMEPVRRVLEDLKSHRIDGHAAHQKLVDALAPHRRQLEAQEVQVEYLAYCLEHSVVTGAI